MIWDLLFHSIPAIVFEWVFRVGLFGIILGYALGPSKTRRALSWIILLLVCVIGWRLANQSHMVSKRYFEILIIPWCILAAYGCTRLATIQFWKKKAGISKVIGGLLALSLMIALFASELIKLSHVDAAKYEVIKLVRECGKEMEGKGDVLIYTNMVEDLKRISYYLDNRNAKVKILLDGPGEDLLFSVQSAVIENVFQNKNVSFLIQTDSANCMRVEDFSIPERLGSWGKTCSAYTSKKKDRLVTKFRFKPEYIDSLSLDPLSIKGNESYWIDLSETVLTGCSIHEGNVGLIQGKNSAIFARKFLDVPTANRIDLNATVKNVGKSRTWIHVGYAYYGKNKNFIGGGSFPYKNLNHIVKVISAKAGDMFFRVDAVPPWGSKCTVALNAKEDLSDIPNLDLLDGGISDVRQLPDGTAEIVMSVPLKNGIPDGTPVRVHAIPGSYAYSCSMILEPGQEKTFVSSVAKFDMCHLYSGKVIPRGVSFVKPLILSYSLNPEEENTIEISDWSVTY